MTLHFTGIVGLLVVCSVTLSAQWLRYPTAGVPGTHDGKPNLAAPATRTARLDDICLENEESLVHAMGR